MGIVSLVVFGLAVAGLYEAAVTLVSVPLLWPLAATAAVVWLGFRELDWRAQRRRQLSARDGHEEAREALRELRTRRTVAEILHRGPYASDLDGQRIGDAERDLVVSALHAHFAAGRLDQGEVEERLANALAAKTAGELRRTVMDLPNGEIDQ